MPARPALDLCVHRQELQMEGVSGAGFSRGVKERTSKICHTPLHSRLDLDVSVLEHVLEPPRPGLIAPLPGLQRSAPRPLEPDQVTGTTDRAQLGLIVPVTAGEPQSGPHVRPVEEGHHGGV